MSELRTTRIAGTVGRDVPCAGSGEPLNSDMAVMFGVGRCPICRGLVQTDLIRGAIDDHTVFQVLEDD